MAMSETEQTQDQGTASTATFHETSTSSPSHNQAKHDHLRSQAIQGYITKIQGYIANGSLGATPEQMQELHEAQLFAQADDPTGAAMKLRDAISQFHQAQPPSGSSSLPLTSTSVIGGQPHAHIDNTVKTSSTAVNAASATASGSTADSPPASPPAKTSIRSSLRKLVPQRFKKAEKPHTHHASTPEAGAGRGFVNPETVKPAVKHKAKKATTRSALQKFVARQFKGDQKTTAADGPNPGIDDATRARAFAWVKKQNPTTTPATVTSSAGSAGVQSGTPAIDVGSPASSSAVAGKPNERVSTPRKPLELTAAQQKLSSIRAEETQRVGANQQMYPNATVVPDEYGRVSREPGARTAYEPWSSRPQQTQSRQNSGFVVGLSGSVAAGDTGAGASFRRVAEAKATERAEHAAAAEKAAQASAPAKPMPFTGHAVKG
jgi:hypothetical protein